MLTGAANILEVMGGTLLGPAADRWFLCIKEYFSQEADSIPKDSMTAKKTLPPENTKKGKTKITSGIRARESKIVKLTPIELMSVSTDSTRTPCYKVRDRRNTLRQELPYVSMLDWFDFVNYITFYLMVCQVFNRKRKEKDNNM